VGNAALDERDCAPAGDLSIMRVFMNRVLGRLVDLRKGEVVPALRACLLLTLIIGGHTLLETARDALFLGKLPANRLAIVYALIAVLAFAVAGPNARFVRRFGERRALLITLLGAAVGTIALYLCPPTPAVVFTIYIWSAFLGTIIVVQFWMFLAHLFTPSQGKRLFGPIAAGGVVGAVAGASGAAAALAIVPVRALLPGATGAFVLAALLSTTMDTAFAQEPAHRRAHAASEPLEDPPSEPEPGPEEPRRSGLTLLWSPCLPPP
jgi:MFS family permease